MNKEEKELVEGIKQYPTHRELCLIHVIERLDEELNKKDKVIDLMAEVIEECRQNGCIEFNEETDLSDIAGEEMVKKYFYKKVEENES